MSTYRPRRAVASTVNTPTSIHINGVSAIDNSEAESIITEFISASEASASSVPGLTDKNSDTDNSTGMSNNVGGNAVLSQLSRVQRDLRGLPPLVAENYGNNATTTKPTESNTIKTEAVNKKIVFDD
ncbi:RNA polymerase I subunit RPA14-domain-containing protein [Scheffersomyces amazonensis]|uniref:RNA polymerase I subunit RPA14-domain-containing protein n=1 Tax=Scheffersomyces amazonensis TaxID=1078765 RepID=UPI00315C803F